MFARLLRHRAWVVLLPLAVGLIVAGTMGARMLWSPTEADGARTVTCWNGAEHPRHDCPKPGGVPGLEWVFPSFSGSSRACHELRHRSTSSLPAAYEWRCRARVSGRPVTITYTVRTSLTRGRAFIASQYPGVSPVTSSRTKRTVWRATRARHGSWTLVEAYRDYPYSVSVAAGTRSARDRALATLVRFRPAPYVVVRPTTT